MLRRVTAFLLVLILIVSCIGLSHAASVRTLKKGSRGDAVKTLQTALKEKGFYGGKIDGIYGKKTVSAVKAYQRKNGLKADGVAGPKTLGKLYEKTETGTEQTAEASVPEAPAPVQPQAETADEAVTYLDSLIARSGASSGTVLLSRNGEVFLSWSFGGVDENTCFRIASITKWVTAIGLMTLYDQGKLDLDKDISAYLGFPVRNPAFPNTPVTARMLMTHTSSLSPDAANYHPDWNRIGKKGYDPIFNESIEPGTQYAYADYNGGLFGSLIEAISGQSVQNYMNQKVFAPLGLTAAYSPRFLPAGTAARDLLNPNGKIQISVQKDRNRAYNNKADPKANNGYLNAETVRLMESEQKGLAESRYGLSTVRLQQFDRGTWYGHQGRYSGLTSNIYYQRETGITMALILNGYEPQLTDNIVQPAFSILTNMERIEEIRTGEKSGT